MAVNQAATAKKVIRQKNFGNKVLSFGTKKVLLKKILHAEINLQTVYSEREALYLNV